MPASRSIDYAARRLHEAGHPSLRFANTQAAGVGFQGPGPAAAVKCSVVLGLLPLPTIYLGST